MKKIEDFLQNKISLDKVFLSLLCLIVVRTVLERLLESGHVFSYGTDFYDTIVEHSHYLFFWICLFLVVSILIRFFIKFNVEQSFRLAVISSPLILTVPVVDFIITGGKGDIINYAFRFNNFGYIYVNLLNPFVLFQEISIGARIEIFLATVSPLILPRLLFGTGIFRCVLLSLSMYHLVILFGFLPAIFASCGVNINLLKELSVTGLIESQAFIFMLVITSLPLATVLFILLFKENRKFFFVMVDFLYPSRLLFYCLILSFGFLYSAVSSNLYPAISNKADMLKLLCAAVSIVTLFSYAKATNDLFDLEIDRISNSHRPLASGVITEREVHTINRMLLIISFVLAICVDRAFIFIWLFLLTASYLYSVPPFRLRCFYPISHLVLSSIGVGVFLGGAAIVRSYQLYNSLQNKWILLYVFFIFFFFSHVKDFKDMKGDDACGVFNLPNKSGRPKFVAILSISGLSVFFLGLLSILNIVTFFTILALALYYIISCVHIFRTKDIKILEKFLLPFTFAAFILAACYWLYFLSW